MPSHVYTNSLVTDCFSLLILYSICAVSDKIFKSSNHSIYAHNATICSCFVVSLIGLIKSNCQLVLKWHPVCWSKKWFVNLNFSKTKLFSFNLLRKFLFTSISMADAKHFAPYRSKIHPLTWMETILLNQLLCLLLEKLHHYIVQDSFFLARILKLYKSTTHL